jgi:hypothetical protein
MWTRFGAARNFALLTSLFFSAIFILEQLLIDQSILNTLPLMIK